MVDRTSEIHATGFDSHWQCTVFIKLTMKRMIKCYCIIVLCC